MCKPEQFGTSAKWGVLPCVPALMGEKTQSLHIEKALHLHLEYPSLFIYSFRNFFWYRKYLLQTAKNRWMWLYRFISCCKGIVYTTELLHCLSILCVAGDKKPALPPNPAPWACLGRMAFWSTSGAEFLNLACVFFHLFKVFWEKYLYNLQVAHCK